RAAAGIVLAIHALTLICWAVQRCRMSESPCRLAVSLKGPSDPAASSALRVSVSDTGVGSKLEEFLELDALARETPLEKWDGTLLITTTGTNDKAIYHYRFNLHENASSSTRCSKMATTYKNNAKFSSGTEVCLCLSNDADIDDFILWLVGFARKVHVLRAAVSILYCYIFTTYIYTSFHMISLPLLVSIFSSITSQFFSFRIPFNLKSLHPQLKVPSAYISQ
uniref:Uncharacterized protein n=1 Tax=Aegilops tauschii subsp. strangulata TaxID=200361 RepID=A0A453SLL9_AEGTS